MVSRLWYRLIDSKYLSPVRRTLNEPSRLRRRSRLSSETTDPKPRSFGASRRLEWGVEAGGVGGLLTEPILHTSVRMSDLNRRDWLKVMGVAGSAPLITPGGSMERLPAADARL